MQMGWLAVELCRSFIYSAIMVFAALLGVSGPALTKILGKMEDPDRMNNVARPRQTKT
jgi:hypothetical protein